MRWCYEQQGQADRAMWPPDAADAREDLPRHFGRYVFVIKCVGQAPHRTDTSGGTV